MNYNGLLAAVLDRVLGGFFRALAEPTVSAVEVHGTMDLLQFSFPSEGIRELNNSLTRQHAKKEALAVGKPEFKSVLGKRGGEGAKAWGCFDHFSVESTCSHVDCRFSHDAAGLTPAAVLQVREKITAAGKTPVAELVD